jgi:hypothetical protein
MLTDTVVAPAWRSTHLPFSTPNCPPSEASVTYPLALAAAAQVPTTSVRAFGGVVRTMSRTTLVIAVLVGWTNVSSDFQLESDLDSTLQA